MGANESDIDIEFADEMDILASERDALVFESDTLAFEGDISQKVTFN